jgi:hypothetical protein
LGAAENGKAHIASALKSLGFGVLAIALPVRENGFRVASAVRLAMNVEAVMPSGKIGSKHQDPAA